MGRGIAEQVVALEVGLDAGPGVVVLVDREEGDLVFDQLLEQGTGLKRR
jgi:mevalonate pyrophosphate decarboxylase